MERITRFRAWMILVAVVAIFGFFSIRLYSMQVRDAEKNRDNVTTYTVQTRVRAARGELLDINGNKLVTNRPSYDLTLNHYVILQADGTNARLLELVKLLKSMDIAYADHLPVTQTTPFAYTLDSQSTSWKNYFRQFLVNRDNMDADITAPLLMKELRKSYRIPDDWSDEDARAVIGLRYELTLRNGVTNLPTYVLLEDANEEVLTAVLALDVPGLVVETSFERAYSTEYAAHILGYIGAMNSDQWAYYKEIDGYDMDALVGQSGLEEAFEEYLHGVDGIRVDEVTKDGTVVRSFYKKEPKPGNNVEISIDLKLQEAAEKKLAEVIENRRDPSINPSKAGQDAEGGAVVAIDVQTGQVLVCGNYPSFDLASLRENWNEIIQADYNPLLNRALMATYNPGSTYKVSMLVAGANAGVVNSATKINDTGIYIKYSGYSPKCLYYTNHGVGHGYLDGPDALKVSCNYYFYWLADHMDIRAIDAVAQGFGLGEKTGVELSERQGTRANPESKAAAFAGTENERWYPSDQLMAGIGHSENYFTPIQLAVYASTLANRGVRYQASFLNRVVTSDYRELVTQQSSKVLSTLPMTQEAISMYLSGMMKVAQEPGGTAYSTFQNYPISVAAKTGTAQIGSGSSNGAFICFAPADNPRIAIAVYGEKVDGGSYLAPVAKAILDSYFGLDSGDVDVLENQVG